MECRSAVHNPRCRPTLNRHLVESGDQAGRIPAGWRFVRRRAAISGELRRREGGVSLWRRHRWCTPLLLLLRWPLDGPGVIANPRTIRLRSLTPAGASALLLVGPAAAVAAATATAAVTTTPTLAHATIPTIGRCRGGGLAGRCSAGGGGGSRKG